MSPLGNPKLLDKSEIVEEEISKEETSPVEECGWYETCQVDGLMKKIQVQVPPLSR